MSHNQIAAQMAANEKFLFWVVLLGAIVLIAFWTAIRYRMRFKVRQRAANRELRREWNEFCARNGLQSYSVTSRSIDSASECARR